MPRRPTDLRAPSRVRLLALSLPTFVFAGYDLARRSFLAAYLSYDLGMQIGDVGWLVMLVGLASIPAEMIAGGLCDRGWRRVGARTLWMAGGTVSSVGGGVALLALDRSSGLLSLALAMLPLVAGWAICNVTHGAWALEATQDNRGRAQVFGLRALAGIGGGVAFSLIGVMRTGQMPSPFAAILIALLVATPLAHLGLIALVPDRAEPAGGLRRAALFAPIRLLFATRGNRRLAGLFALNGAHTATTTVGYLYLVGAALAIPEWGPTGILLQSICAAVGIAAVITYGSRVPPIQTLRVICWINLLLAMALIALPPGRPAALMLWSALFGLVSAIDFMALRVLLGDRLDLAARADDASARAAAYYAAFHLPFNLCAALATGVLFAGYRLLGFDPAAAHGAEHPYVAAQLMPALYALILMTASLRLVRRYRQEQAAAPAPQAPAEPESMSTEQV